MHNCLDGRAKTERERGRENKHRQYKYERPDTKNPTKNIKKNKRESVSQRVSQSVKHNMILPQVNA